MLPFLAPILGPVMSAISTALASLTKVLPVIGKQVAAFIAKIPAPVLEKCFSGMLDLMRVMVKNIFNFDSPCDELGYKAKISDKKSEDFDSTTEYINHLNKDIKFDQAKFDSLSNQEKMECTLHGMHITHKAIEDKFGMLVSPLFFALNTMLKIQPDVVVRSLTAIKESGTTTEDFVNYFKGTLSQDKANAVDVVVKKIFNTEDNSKSIIDMMRETREMGL